MKMKGKNMAVENYKSPAAACVDPIKAFNDARKKY
jgi:hypothetical protein